MVPHSGFDLHFSDNEWCWASYHLLNFLTLKFPQVPQTVQNHIHCHIPQICPLILLNNILSYPVAAMGTTKSFFFFLCVYRKSLQLCLTFCDPMDCSPPWSSVHGIFQARNTGAGLPCPPPGDLSDPGIEPVSLMSPALAARFFTTGAT